MKAVQSLVLLASDGAFRLLRNDGVGHGLTELRHQTRDEFPDVDVSYSDKLAKTTHGQSVSHAAEPRRGKAEMERDRMAAHIVSALDDALSRGNYDRLYVSAPDKMLGVLRKQLSPAASRVLAGDLDKDLVKVPVADLARHFDGVALF